MRFNLRALCVWISAVAIGVAAGCAAPARRGTGVPDGALSGVVADPALASLSWLTGSWERTDADESSEEHWTSARGGTMLGVSRTVAAGRTTFFEYLRIEARADGVYYLASPLGRQPPTAFRLIECADRRAVFENPEHDFPQRVIYWRSGDDTLCARIEGDEAGTPQAVEWCWERRRGWH